MRFILSTVILFLSLIACTSSKTNSNYRTPASTKIVDGLTWDSQDTNNSIWKKYCVGDANSATVPQPNYSNELVQNAAKNVFKYVASNSFYLYPTIVNAYGLKDSTPPDGITKEAHTFLTYLCGEFRDRASMVEAKLVWLTKFNKLRAGAQKPIPAEHENVWADFSANSYNSFLKYSNQLWHARQNETKILSIPAGSVFKVEQTYSEPSAVDGMTVCAVKYMVNEIANGRNFTDLSAHNTGYSQYAKKCPQADKEDYYNFRGDSNFKPNSPESNGMIWYANHIAANCTNTQKSRSLKSENIVTNTGNIVTDDVCTDYFKNPFRRRWQAARSGLATWLLHSENHNAEFADDASSPIVVWPHRIKNEASTIKPFAYKVQKNWEMTAPLEEWIPAYKKTDFVMDDFNFNKNILQLSKSAGFERLRNAMNRHTNWYQSQWDDGLGSKNSFKTQAYSPFVASSYEPSESDQFTFCGITVPCPPDGFKHWMFVFRVKGKNWFRLDDLVDGRKDINFSYHWLDETSLGTTPLADKEHAWDRLGTALEEELEGGAILYLHNLTQGSWKDNAAVSDDGNNP